MKELTAATVQKWLDDYLEAWRTCDTDSIGRLFTEDATYRYHPGDDPVVGRAAIVADWQRSPDPPGSWTAAYSPWLVGGDRAIATGETSYTSGKEYWNVFQLVFRDGRCCEFVEWFMTPRKAT